ncbi:MAG: aldo/keto reductase [Geminicoccaceae bacterium]
MKYVRLGRSGMKVSALCLGTMTMGTSAWRPWVLNREETRPILARALELGINYFDLADWYSTGVNEEVVTSELLAMTRRDQLVLTTKCYYPMGDGPNDRGLSRKHIMESIDRSLKAMGTDYVDVYMMHAYDPETPIEETLEAFNDIVRAGKALYIGCSTMWAWQFSKIIHLCRHRGWAVPAVMQCQHNLVYRENEFEMFPLCEDEGVAVTPFSPLARGFLTGDRSRTGDLKSHRAKTDNLSQNYFREENDFLIAERVQEIADRRGVSASQIALTWVTQQNSVTSPLVGVDSVAQVEEAVAALDIVLSPAELLLLEEPYQRRDMIIDHPAVRTRVPPKLLEAA